MAKAKKGKGKKKKQLQDDPNALTEVDRTFYELTIADLNRKLARLRSLTTDLEEKNMELLEQYDKNEEDKSDIITFLKRMLQEKTNEIQELEERITGLQETRQNETEQFETKISELEQEYKEMHEQLTSENKLLEGKLNSLEEFRSQRDDLMKKFEDQEKKMETQDKKHAREIYEIERKFIISKDKLKKDMEARLLQLSTEFHDASELRIAATTQRVIRENIAVNNELDYMLQTHQKLYRDYQNLKNKGTTFRQEAELHETEKKNVLARNRVQKSLLEKIASKNEHLRKDLSKYKHYEQESRVAKENILEQIEKNKHLEYKVRLLEQNLHKIKCDNCELKTKIRNLKADNERLDDILMEGVSCIKESLTIKTESDASIKSIKRENLINTLFLLLSKAHDRKITKPSLESVKSAKETYTIGDLGFVPKPIDDVRPEVPMKRNIFSQVGESFEEFLKMDGSTRHTIKKSYADKRDSELDITSEDNDDEVIVEEEEIEKKESVLFFNEEEAPEEETDQESAEFDPFTDIEHSDESQTELQQKKPDESKMRTESIKEEIEEQTVDVEKPADVEEEKVEEEMKNDEEAKENE